MLAAIVLAAGASERMGGHPKALLSWHGEAFLSGILKACFAAGIERRVAVLGHHADQILERLVLDDVTVVHSTDLDAGPIGSIRTAIASVARHPVSGILVWPVDRPHVQVATIEALCAAMAAHAQPIILPRYQGRRGHPVIFRRELFDELLAVANDEGARAVVRRDPARVFAVDVRDPAVVQDVNTPDEYQALVRRADRSE